MQSKTSYFNLTVFKKNVSRFWPLWAAYTLIWILILTLPLMSELRYWSWNIYNSQARFAYQVLEMAKDGGILMGFIFGPLAAMAVWSYLNTAKSAGMFAALPIKREGMFITNYLSGLCCLLAGNCIVFLLTLGVEALYGLVQIMELLQWLALVSMSCVFFYSFATLIAMMTGHIIVLPLLYGILSFTSIGVEGVIRFIIAPVFFYGFAERNWSFISVALSPMVYMFQNTDVSAIWSEPVISLYATSGTIIGYYFSGWGVMTVYCAAGIVLAAIALLMYRRRHMESAGDVIAVRQLRPVFKYVFSAGCALVLGALFFGIVFPYYDRSNPSLAAAMCLCMVIGGILGCYVAEMLLKKSVRVWRDGLRGALMVAAAVVVFSAVFEFDLFGLERRLPDAGTVTSARVSVSGVSNYYNISFSDKENIGDILALHRSAVGKKTEYENSLVRGITFSLEYYTGEGESNTLILSRRYFIPWEGDEYQYNSDSDYNALLRLINTDEARAGRNFIPVPVTADSITSCYIHYWDREGEYGYVDLGSVKGAQLYNDCIVPDRKTGSLDYAWLVRDDNFYATHYNATIYLEVLQKYIDENGTERYTYHSVNLTPTIDALRTLEWLREQGIELTLERDIPENRPYYYPYEAPYAYVE